MVPRPEIRIGAEESSKGWRRYILCIVVLSVFVAQCAPVLRGALTCEGVQILSNELTVTEAEDFCLYAISPEYLSAILFQAHPETSHTSARSFPMHTSRGKMSCHDPQLRNLRMTPRGHRRSFHPLQRSMIGAFAHRSMSPKILFRTSRERPDAASLRQNLETQDFPPTSYEGRPPSPRQGNDCHWGHRCGRSRATMPRCYFAPSVTASP